MVNFTLHAGLHKTATTSLQEHVFPNVASAHYTGKCRYVMAMRRPLSHQQLVQFLASEDGELSRLPLHVCLLYLAQLQDYLVAQIARSVATLGDLADLLKLNRELVTCIAGKTDHGRILYSCEGLLLSRGHLEPESSLVTRDLFPLAHCRQLFPGSIDRVVVYLRSPVDYLFSRYIQIHTVRCRGKGHADHQRLISIEQYLDLNERLWRGETPSQSVFHHIFQQQLIAELRSLGLPLVIRSYDKHIRGAESISTEFGKAFGLQVHHPERVDHAFRDIRLNTTSDHKDYALNLLLQAGGFSDRASLQEIFAAIAMRHPLVKEALATTVFSAR